MTFDEILEIIMLPSQQEVNSVRMFVFTLQNYPNWTFKKKPKAEPSTAVGKI
jgi:hypothetical protein